MFRFVLPHCYRYVTSTCLRQAKSHFKLGLLITFHYHTLLCNCQKARSGNITFCVQMADQISSDASSFFSGKVDRYKGVHIKSTDNPCNLANFTSKLEAALPQWISDKLQAVWFFVSLEHSDWIPTLTKFGCSDLYFIVELSPLSSAITSCEVEIEDCQWMDMDTYLSHPNVHENNRLFVRKYLFTREKGLSINGTKTVHPVTKAPQMLFALGPVD